MSSAQPIRIEPARKEPVEPSPSPAKPREEARRAADGREALRPRRTIDEPMSAPYAACEPRTRPAAPPPRRDPRRHVSCEAASKAPSDAAATEPPLRYMCIHQFSSVHSLLPWSIGPTEYAHTQGVGVTKNHTRHASVRPIG